MFRPLLTCPAYHHVGDSVPAAAAHLGVCTTTATFEAHLDYYQANYDVVDLETLLHRPWPRRPLLLAFDDSYRSLVDTVAPILKRRGLHAVAFLNPDMIENKAVQFDHVLSELASRFGVARLLATIGPAALAAGTVQAYINGAAKDLTRSARRELQMRLLAAFDFNEATLHTELDVYLRPEDVRCLTEAGFEIANHTASHARCRTLSSEDLAPELTGAQQRLARLSGRPVRAFSVPYGSRHDATPEALAALAASGHEAVFLADGRLSANGSAGMQIWDRIPIDGIGVEALSLHLGVRPRLRGIKDLALGWRHASSAATVARSATSIVPALPA